MGNLYVNYISVFRPTYRPSMQSSSSFYLNHTIVCDSLPYSIQHAYFFVCVFLCQRIVTVFQLIFDIGPILLQIQTSKASIPFLSALLKVQVSTAYAIIIIILFHIPNKAFNHFCKSRDSNYLITISNFFLPNSDPVSYVFFAIGLRLPVSRPITKYSNSSTSSTRCPSIKIFIFVLFWLYVQITFVFLKLIFIANSL